MNILFNIEVKILVLMKKKRNVGPLDYVEYWA